MIREVQGIILMLVGIVILRISWGTAYLDYVKESMRPWLLASGAILVIVGVLALVDALRRGGVSEAEAQRSDEEIVFDGVEGDHDHAHGGPRAAWLLVLPILVVFVVAPPALGAWAAARDTTNSVAAQQALPPLPPGDPVPVFLSDYVTRAVWEQGVSLEGRTVELTGFAVSTDDGGWQLARMQIQCCAADAFASKVQPVGLPPDFADVPENTWLTVTGQWVPGDAAADGSPGATPSSSAIPLVQVGSIAVVPEPVNPYD